MNVPAIVLPNIVVFWLLTVATVFAGWSIFTAQITALKGDTKWEVRIVYHLGRILICMLAIAVFLLASWGLMWLSVWVFTQ